MHDEPIRPGYKRTEVGIIPEDWEVKRLGEITSSTAGGTPSTKIDAYWGGNIKWMNSGELHYKRIYDVEGRITEAGLKNSSAKLIPPRCVLVGLAGQGKTRGTVAINMVQLCTNQSIAAILPSDSFVPEYLYFNLDSRYEELRNLSTGAGGRGGLNLTILNSLMIPFPSYSEQTAIAEVLSDVDALLDALDRLIAKKRAIKQGAMQALLTGRVRLPGFSGEWQIVQAGEIGEFGSGSGFPTKFQGNSSGDYPFFKVSDMNNEGNTIFMATANNFIDEIIRKQINASLFPANSIVFAKIGAAVFLERKKVLVRPSCIDNNMAAFVLDARLADFRFIHYALLNVRLGDIVSTSALPSLNVRELAAIEFHLPSLPEQTAIAEVLSDMDAEIEALEKRRAKLRDIKQGMMQELLTGRIRLVPPQEQAEEANV